MSFRDMRKRVSGEKNKVKCKFCKALIFTGELQGHVRRTHPDKWKKIQKHLGKKEYDDSNVDD